MRALRRVMARALSGLVSGVVLALAGLGAQAQPAAAPVGRVVAPGAFDRIEIDGSARIRVTQGEREQVFIPGDESAQRGVEVDLVDRRLRIRAGDGWKFWREDRPTIDVQVRQLTHVTMSGAGEVQAPGPVRCDQLVIGISGSGSVRFDELAARQLRFDISGAGDGQLAGRVEQLELNVSGRGKLMADQLRTARAKVAISGVGTAELWVIDDLQLAISGAGRIDFWGHPVVRRAVSGMGNITPRGDKP
ncbi:head GIN domain-containing protein [Rhizobacter sp. SG703]|uniref:GIN domain-containing protein n=1 Tax=Rhizobacter sp. SG703 TaxID=2587140 RepID=UPI001447E93E|nr:hypothetical protein [Rhizobacter sp. SG703]